MSWPAEAVDFATKHPFEVVDKQSGQTLVRFSNVNAAFDTARSIAREYPLGIDIVQHGLIVGHWEVARPIAESTNWRPR